MRPGSYRSPGVTTPEGRLLCVHGLDRMGEYCLLAQVKDVIKGIIELLGPEKAVETINSLVDCPGCRIAAAKPLHTSGSYHPVRLHEIPPCLRSRLKLKHIDLLAPGTTPEEARENAYIELLKLIEAYTPGSLAASTITLRAIEKDQVLAESEVTVVHPENNPWELGVLNCWLEGEPLTIAEMGAGELKLYFHSKLHHTNPSRPAMPAPGANGGTCGANPDKPKLRVEMNGWKPVNATYDSMSVEKIIVDSEKGRILLVRKQGINTELLIKKY